MTTHASYAQQRDELNQNMATQVPAELMRGFGAAAEQRDKDDFAARAPKLGDAAPSFSLPDQNGNPTHLSELLDSGPVVVIFYRGEWCPYCNLQLRAFQAHLDQIREHGAQLVAISPQTPDHSLSMAEKNELGFRVLTDAGARVIERYGLLYEIDEQTRALMESVGTDLTAFNGETGWVLPANATFVIDTDGSVRYANVRGNWTERAEPVDVLTALGELR
jgi:peroxiredoxin